MRTIARFVLAVLAGAAVWAALWLSGTAFANYAFPDTVVPNQPLTHVGILVGYLVYSVALSVLAGLVTALAAGSERPMRAVAVLAALQLAMGIAAEVSYWDLMPVWYHLVFLGLVVPATLYGGTLRRRGAASRMAAAV